MTPDRLTEALKCEAMRLGFDLVGICPAVRPPHWDQFRQWLAEGNASQMHYMGRRLACYEHPRSILPEARSLILLGMNYRTERPADTPVGYGRISRYAWGDDYHGVIRSRLRRLVRLHRALAPGAQVRAVVDTAPLLERDFAQLAGLGWIGKNTLLIHPRFGSWVFLAAVLTSERLAYDQPFEKDLCRECGACLDACPSGALLAPRRLDARRCISYTTIELRGHVPRELRPQHGCWVFGCDVCQEVCPWNRRTPQSKTSAFAPLPRTNPLPLVDLFATSDELFRERFRRMPLWRARRSGLLRNAAIVLGNQQAANAMEALSRGLEDQAPEVRAASAWALGQLGPVAGSLLRSRLEKEAEALVRREIAEALSAGERLRDHL